MPPAPKEKTRLARLHPCPECGANPGQPCRRANGDACTHTVRGVDPALLRYKNGRTTRPCPCGYGDLHHLCGKPVIL